MTVIPITNYKINSISPVYTHYNQYFYPKHEEEYSNKAVKYGKIQKYRLISIIGSGKYSLVFSAQCPQGFCAVKILRNVSFQKIHREIYILKRVRVVSNVIKLYDVIRDKLTGTFSIVTEFFKSDNSRQLYPKLTLDEIRYYLYIILYSLDRCHSLGVMHRDIKPGNVLINNKNRDVLIIDWGLADLYYPMKQYSVRVSTMRYKAPELLLNYHFYDYGIDVWGVGCIMAEMLFSFNFIKGSKYEEVLGSITELWGKDVIYNYCDKYGIDIPETFKPYIDKYDEPNWDKKINSFTGKVKDNDAIDLLKKMLCVDHGERITARDALKHPFFYPLYLKS